MNNVEDFQPTIVQLLGKKKERKKTDTPNEGWDEDRVPTSGVFLSVALVFLLSKFAVKK